MSRMAIILVLCVLRSIAAGQEGSPDHSGEVYALASALGGDGRSAAGFQIGGAWEPSPRVGLVADFGRNFDSDTHVSVYTFMAGPRVYSEEHYRVSGFFQILAGAGQTSAPGRPADWNAVFAPGVGADIRLTDKLVWRAIAVDLTLTSGPGVLRVSSGFVYRFRR